jgi:hypothetical protein
VTSCGDSNNVELSPRIPISCKNQNAIEFYNKAELKKSRGDLIGSISSYKAALRIDPSFFMAALHIPITDSYLKSNYLKVATSNIENLTPSERLLLKIYNSNSNEEKREFAKQLVDLNKNSSEAKFVLASTYGSYSYPGAGGLKILKDILENEPTFYDASRRLFNTQYPRFDWRYQKEISKSNDSINLLLSRIDNLIKLDTLNPSIYRQFGDFFRGIDPKITKEYYSKGLEISNIQGNSYRSELLLAVAYADFLLGNLNEMYIKLDEVIEIEFEPLLKVKRYFQYVNMCLADGDLKKAIVKLNFLENELNQIGLDDKNINEVLVSIRYIESIIFALSNESLNSKNSLNNYLKESDLLLKNTPNLNSSFISNRNNELQGIGIVGGLDDRLIEGTKHNQIRNIIFVNILNKNIKYSKNLISSIERGELSPREILFFNDLINYKTKKYTSIVKSFQENSELISAGQISGYFRGWHNFIYGISLYENGKIKESKDALYGFANSTGFNFNNVKFKKRAKEILNE